MRRIRRLIAAIAVCIVAAPLAADEAAHREALRIEVEQLRESGGLSLGDVDIASGAALAEFYERREFRPAWSDPSRVTDLRELVAASPGHGLNPADYHADVIETAYRALGSSEPQTDPRLAALDLILTDSLIRLGYHLVLGRVDPRSLDPHWNFRAASFGPDPLATLEAAVEAPSLAEFIAPHMRHGPYYSDLRQALVEYRGIAAAGGWPPVPGGRTLKPGVHDERVPILARRLAVTGDIDAAIAAAATTSYDETIVAGVRRFQERHALEIDGVVGPTTLNALNVPVETRVDQLRLNLERARWVLENVEEDILFVNIAGFGAYVARGGKIVWQTKVQVGATYHQTPIFRGDMKYIVLNPTWTVPYSIATKEMLPRIKQDPDYFANRDFDVKDRPGNLVDPSKVDWSQVTRGNFSYTFVQRAGPDNALGRVKFIFPNEYSVYLHDTPSKSLFDRADRAFSHGCIRVQNPLDLAAILLASDGWDRERIDAVIESGETKAVFLSKPLSVLLLYWTAWADPDGVVRFYNDGYGRDAPLLAALDTPFRLPAAPQ